MNIDQIKVIEHLKNRENVQINATAGSGKTTICLHIAREFPDKKILLINYNKG